METINNIPPSMPERDTNGLLKTLQLKFKEDGTVDWRAIIPNQFLYVNTQFRGNVEKRYGKKIEEIDLSKDKIEDCDLVINLAGIKFLLASRGFNSLKYIIGSSSTDYASVTAQIEFIGNYETNGQPRIYSDCASAHYGTTNGFGQKYLLEIASNRAMCRAVRNFLQVNVVSKEELNSDSQDSNVQSNNPLDPKNVLQRVMDEKGYSFAQLKLKLAKNHPESVNYKDIYDIPNELTLQIVQKLQNKS